ncbi:hypothetical protein IFM89_011890 [Coptis chinensis]|uniref:TF-B3 domain-containing protein n=1 Tax=Coptis chinensis TaxID=261450 RepID=A0A835I2E9_9MAGN|nr:hypothetical protein IFM89_011890 [Coptis chinensis]
MELPDFVMMKVPSSKEWHVELREVEGQVWFHSGWQEFVEYHSIRIGHFLLFQYDGNSRFNVVIFDMSASEIEYPWEGVDSEETCNEVGSHASDEQREDAPVEILEVFPIEKASDASESQKIHSNYTTTFQRPQFSLRSIAEKKAETTSSSGFNKLRKKILGQSKNPGCRASPYRNKKLNMKTERAIAVVGAFTSENPCCTVTMQWFVLKLPIGFAKTYMEKDAHDVMLCVPDGRTWQAQCTSGEGQARLVRGWKAFVFDNHLEVDDICIFELVDKKLRELKVSIFRIHQDTKQGNENLKELKIPICEPSCLERNMQKQNEDFSMKRRYSYMKESNETLQVSEAESPALFQDKETAIIQARAFSSRYPFCTVTMRLSYVRGPFKLNLPIFFARTYLKGVQEVTLRASDGRMWKLLYSCKKYSKKYKARFCQGWKKFVLDNSLEEDDICIFELVDERQRELKVASFESTKIPNRGKELMTCLCKIEKKVILIGSAVDGESCFNQFNE